MTDCTEESELSARVAETESALAALNTDEEGNPIGEITLKFKQK